MDEAVTVKYEDVKQFVEGFLKAQFSLDFCSLSASLGSYRRCLGGFETLGDEALSCPLLKRAKNGPTIRCVFENVCAIIADVATDEVEALDWRTVSATFESAVSAAALLRGHAHVLDHLVKQEDPSHASLTTPCGLTPQKPSPRSFRNSTVASTPSSAPPQTLTSPPPLLSFEPYLSDTQQKRARPSNMSNSSNPSLLHPPPR